MKKLLLLCSMSIGLIIGCKKDNPITFNEVADPEKSALSFASRNSLPFELESVSLNEGVNLNLLNLDSIASIHNEAMEYIVNRIEADGTCPSDEEEFRNDLAIYLQDFLYSKGLSTSVKINSIEGSQSYDPADFCVNEYGLSLRGSEIICDLQNTFDAFTSNSTGESDFVTQVNDLVDEANEIQDIEERRVVQLSLTICKSSSIFWKNNLDRLTTKLGSICTGRGTSSANKNAIP